ncbi:MAG TPA: peroxide stress protein YaaA [Dietzia timorensis]|uniref:Peroxide stress protein YaaA n=1 Tax=Dietzia timorensis TaxID=499555 RepID=A0A921F4P3_9ACTN|nr:peroxide stress protein YaaA [Dietzia timorensis]HJE90823.1 peroxide stress protein YaaA [Dietzia timorensis]
MRILLPPSETKSFGGSDAPLDLEALSFSEHQGVTSLRRALVTELSALCAGPAEIAAKALGLSEKQAPAELEANAELLSAPTAPAISRYTGVLYDALDFGSLTKARKDRARDTILVGSALFGLVGAADQIPHYRLSASSSLPTGGTLRSRWTGPLTEALADFDEELVVDLRSGGYRALGPDPGAVTVDVVSVLPDGSRKVITHFNKHYKGVLTRALVSSRATIDDVRSLRRVASKAGIELDVDGENPRALTMVLREQ